MSESSEEKVLPPSDKKLREARKKGQIPRSKDMASGVVLIATLSCVYFISSGFFSDLQLALTHTLDVQNEDFAGAAREISKVFFIICIKICITVFVVVIFSSFLINTIINKGFLFALEPLKPKIETLNVFDGIKKLFTVKSLIEIVKSLIKTVAFSAIIVVIMYSMLNLLVRAPSCGMGCFIYSFLMMLKPIMIATFLMLLVFGGADVLLQKWLFMRDQKMTKTEAKRERMDQEGNPEIKASMRRVRREMMQGRRVGVSQATILIRGKDAVIAFRYVAGETAVPVLVARGQGETANRMLEDAKNRNIPVHDDAPVVKKIINSMRVGKNLDSKYFSDIARALYVVGAVK